MIRDFSLTTRSDKSLISTTKLPGDRTHTVARVILEHLDLLVAAHWRWIKHFCASRPTIDHLQPYLCLNCLLLISLETINMCKLLHGFSNMFLEQFYSTRAQSSVANRCKTVSRFFFEVVAPSIFKCFFMLLLSEGATTALNWAVQSTGNKNFVFMSRNHHNPSLLIFKWPVIFL